MEGEYYLNVCGLGSPEPVMRLKKLLDSIEQGKVKVRANSSITQDHIVKFAAKMGYACKSDEKGDEYLITIIKEKEDFPIGATSTPFVILIKDNALGKHNGLGEQLLSVFIQKIKLMPNQPTKIIFMNEGVFLTTKEEYQTVIDDLKILESKGIEILSCFTCLKFFNLSDEVKVGQIGNALDILNDLTQNPSLVL